MAATTEVVVHQDADQIKAERERFVVVDVGPIKVRFQRDRVAPDAVRPAPTIESLVDDAWRVFPARVDYRHTDPASVRMAAMRKATKAQRESARFAVVGASKPRDPLRRRWTKPDGSEYTLGELMPLVTAVRKALAADLRAREREAIATERREAREAAKMARLRERALEKLHATEGAAHAAFVLPVGVKLKKGVSTDDSRHVAMKHAHLARHGKGWEVICTDGYQLTIVPVKVSHPAAFEAVKSGYHTIPAEALAAIDKAGAFRVDKSGAVVPCEVSNDVRYLQANGKLSLGYTSHHVTLMRRRDVGSGYMPPTLRDGEQFDAVKVYGGKRRVKNPTTGRMHSVNVPGLVPDLPPDKHRIEVTLNAVLLAQVAAAIGSNGSQAIRLSFDARQLEKTDSGLRQWTVKPLHVIPNANMETAIRRAPRSAGVRSVQMPVRPGMEG